MERRKAFLKGAAAVAAVFGVLRTSASDSSVQPSLHHDLEIKKEIKYVFFNDIDELRTFEPSDERVQAVLHEYRNGSGKGGGVFYYDKNDKVSKDDNGTVIVINNKRWKRKFDGNYRPEFFGAIGDGKTDDTKALQKALDAAINHKLILSSCIYRSRNLYINGPLIIQGAGRRVEAALVPLPDTSGNFISINCLESPTFYDLTISARAITLENKLTGVFISSNNTKKYSPSIIMYNCNINSFTGNCLYSSHGRHMGVIENCQIEYSCLDSVVINGVDWNISHSSIGYTKNGNGIVITQPTYRIANCDVYFNSENGVLLQRNAINGYFSNNVINSNGKTAISIESVSPNTQGHIIAGNFFFNNSRKVSGVYSNVFLAKNVVGVNLNGNTHYSYSKKSERPRFLLELSEGADAELLTDLYDNTSYSEKVVSVADSTLNGESLFQISSTKKINKIVQSGRGDAFNVTDLEGNDVFKINSFGSISIYNKSKKPVVIEVDQNAQNQMNLMSGFSVGEKETEGNDGLSYVKIGRFFLWDDLGDSLRISKSEPKNLLDGIQLYKL